MTTTRSCSRIRTLLGTGFAAALVVAPLAGCSSDDGDDAAETTTTIEAEESTTTEAPAEDEDTTTSEAAEETTTTEVASTEIGTTELLDWLNENHPEIGAMFDWNTGDGVIGVNYMGVQTVGLYAVTSEVDTAIKACEAASEYVHGVDPEADIEVFTGGYSAATKVAARVGDAGTCAAV